MRAEPTAGRPAGNRCSKCCGLCVSAGRQTTSSVGRLKLVSSQRQAGPFWFWSTSEEWELIICQPRWCWLVKLALFTGRHRVSIGWLPKQPMIYGPVQLACPKIRRLFRAGLAQSANRIAKNGLQTKASAKSWPKIHTNELEKAVGSSRQTTSLRPSGGFVRLRPALCCVTSRAASLPASQTLAGFECPRNSEPRAGPTSELG